MRWSLILGAGVAVAALALPARAIVKLMSLREMMEVTHDCLDAQIVAKETFRSAEPDLEGMVFTRLTVQGESMRTGEPVTTEVVYAGSHDPADNYGTSEMPMFQDVRLGNRVVLFYGKDAQNATGENQVWAYHCVYRCETVMGEPILIGKGEGHPFADNVKLSEARERVRTTHLELQAAATGAAPAQK